MPYPSRLRSQLTACAWTALCLSAVAMATVGCGRRDLGAVTGLVVANGSPRGFRLPESMNVTFSMDDAKLPRGFTTPVKEDGTFSVDMNDGTGRGVPFGTYVVAIDTNNVRMKSTDAAPSTNESAGADGESNDYPRPSREAMRSLGKAKLTIQVVAGKRIHIVVDLDKGTITEAGKP